LVTNPIEFSAPTKTQTPASQQTAPQTNQVATPPIPITRNQAPRVRSLKASFGSKTVSKQQKEVHEKIGEYNFTQDELNLKWDELVSHFGTVDSWLANILDSTNPKLKPNFIIQIPLRSKLQKNSIEKKHDTIMGILKPLLQNSQIQFEFEINEAETKEIKEEHTVFTSKQKYDYLKKKNPDIELLKKELGLDLI
jgi:DNA polymerase-3 subunit gamma/tau